MNKPVLLVSLALAVAAPGLSAPQGSKLLTLDLVNRPGDFGGGRGGGGLRFVWRPNSGQLSFVRAGGGAAAGGDGAVLAYEAADGKERPIVQLAAGGERLSLASLHWFPAGDGLLAQSVGDLWRVDAATGASRRLTNDSGPEGSPAISPPGTGIAFVRSDDLYTVDVANGQLQRLTADGGDVIHNGVLDWVYGEELAGRTNTSFEWSPDGKKIAFLRLDDSRVPNNPIVDFLSTTPRQTPQRYPCPGDPNPVPSIHIAAVGGSAPQRWTATLPPGTEYVAPQFSWTPDGRALAYLSINRRQNEVRLHLWDPAAATDRELFVERDATWINLLEPPLFLKDGRFLWLSERDGWAHIYLYSADGRLQRQLTRGEWQVDVPVFGSAAPIAVDEKGGWVYFTSTQASPLERQGYRVSLDGGAPQRLTREPGTHSIRLSPDGSGLLETYSSISQPPLTRLLRADGTPVATLQQSPNRLAEYRLGRTEFVQVNAADGTVLHARLVKPADFDPSRRYPVIVRIYGGPAIQSVRNTWNLTSTMDHFLAQEGYLIWQLDNRGSAGRGHAWEATIYRNLGKRELEDQLAGVNYLKSLPFVDGTRLALWGWSYGGYMTLYALTNAPEVFKCGVAGAAVADWRLYDTIYTERYMQTPADNPEGYKAASPVTNAARLQAKLLLIHGTSDTNVHVQNTMQFFDGLVRARKPCELYIQPGQGHGFGGPAVGPYLNQKVVEFLKRSL